jgi:hypothetical protein
MRRLEVVAGSFVVVPDGDKLVRAPLLAVLEVTDEFPWANAGRILVRYSRTGERQVTAELQAGIDRNDYFRIGSASQNIFFESSGLLMVPAEKLRALVTSWAPS